jgi:prepilin-type processing-associated H-X9-DG protein
MFLVRALVESKRHQAFTRTDLSVLLVTVVLVLAIWVPHATAKSKVRGTRIHCVSNLKQMALAFRMWASEHEDQFPMHVSWQSGGSKELTLRGWVAPSFWAISNELNSPKVLACPADKKRWPPFTNFASLTDRKISYFLGLDSALSNPQSVLSGDRNLDLNNVPAPAGLVSITDPQTVSWNRKSLHQAAGNLAFADGSVQQVNTDRLRKSLEASGSATNTVVVP